MPLIRRSDCVLLPIVVCPDVAVVMLESRVARCVRCVEKRVEILLITNKSLFVASSWSHLYLLIKDARSLEHKVRKTIMHQCLSLTLFVCLLLILYGS